MVAYNAYACVLLDVSNYLFTGYMTEKECFYWKFKDFIDSFKVTTENRKLFLDHLYKIERAIRHIEWVNKKESTLEKENEYIIECLKCDSAIPTPQDTNFFPLTKWKQHFTHPTYGAIRNIVYRRDDNGADYFLKMVNHRFYVDIKKFHEWFEKHSLSHQKGIRK